MATIPEHKILKPRDPSIEDSNDWEQFHLTGVEVRNATTNELSNMLLADAGNPLSVTGRLGNVEPEQAHLRMLNCIDLGSHWLLNIGLMTTVAHWLTYSSNTQFLRSIANDPNRERHPICLWRDR